MTQSIINYDQFSTQYASRLLQPIYHQIVFSALADSFGPLGGPKEFVFAKTGAKLIQWPPNCQMKHICSLYVIIGNISEQVAKVTQSKMNYYQF